MTNTILITLAAFVVILEFIRVVMDLYNHYQTNEYLKWIERHLTITADEMVRLVDETESDNEKYWNRWDQQEQENLKEVSVNDGNSSNVTY